MAEKTNQLKYGIQKEKKIANVFKKSGAKVELSPGSRGAADLKVKFATGTKWNVQVKSTRKGEAAMPSPKDLGRLKISASRTGATAVVARVSPEGVDFVSARTGKKLNPPSKKKGK